MNFSILCADWGKEPVKRRAWELKAGTSLVQPVCLNRELRLSNLIDYATSLGGPVLIGIDAAIGVPRHVGEQYRNLASNPEACFLDWAKWLFEHEKPYLPCTTPDEWHCGRPFIHIPKGQGAKLAFPNSGIGLNRETEQGLGANSPLIVSGLPGTVGSGSRALWEEMVECLKVDPNLENAFWPFAGRLDNLLASRQIIIAEIYPKACYGLALADDLPANLVTIAKTKAPARAKAISMLLERLDSDLQVEAIDLCYGSEDDFDAMISVVALHRLLGSPLALREPRSPDHIEGDILGRWAIEPGKGVNISGNGAPTPRGPQKPGGKIEAAREQPAFDRPFLQSNFQSRQSEGRRCPIPGCSKQYKVGRLGWDAHVGSIRSHPGWHPEETDGERRKILFRNEYPEFFES